jgi:hypothetical protein
LTIIRLIESDGELGDRGIRSERVKGKIFDFQVFAVENPPQTVTGMVLFFIIRWGDGRSFGLVEESGIAGKIGIGKGAATLGVLENGRGGRGGPGVSGGIGERRAGGV